MKDVMSRLPQLAMSISRSLNGGFERYLEELRRVDKWLSDAHFICNSADPFIRFQELSHPEVHFQFARQWTRKPTRIPSLILESRLVLSPVNRVELVIQRSEENYLVLTAESGFPVAARRYYMDARLDTRHDDAFALAIRRLGIRNGTMDIEPERIATFLSPILEQL